jgi:hypothetical protein
MFVLPSSFVLGSSSTHESPHVSLNIVMSALHVLQVNGNAQTGCKTKSKFVETRRDTRWCVCGSRCRVGGRQRDDWGDDNVTTSIPRSRANKFFTLPSLNPNSPCASGSHPFDHFLHPQSLPSVVTIPQLLKCSVHCLWSTARQQQELRCNRFG